jgi:hypothetical protein
MNTNLLAITLNVPLTIFKPSGMLAHEFLRGYILEQTKWATLSDGCLPFCPIGPFGVTNSAFFNLSDRLLWKAHSGKLPFLPLAIFLFVRSTIPTMGSIEQLLCNLIG